MPRISAVEEVYRNDERIRIRPTSQRIIVVSKGKIASEELALLTSVMVSVTALETSGALFL
jgi:hypothetical protein